MIDGTKTPGHPVPRSVVVVFSNQVDINWLRILKSGFRHCFALVEQPAGWTLVDPLSTHLLIDDIAPLSAPSLIQWYQEQGLTCILTRPHQTNTRPAPVNFFSCVEVVKRLLGIHKLWIQTPYQLYNYLLNEKSP